MKESMFRNKSTTIMLAALLCQFFLCVNPAPVLGQRENVVDYGLWADVLQSHVDEDGLVDYQKLKKDQSKLNAFVAEIEGADLSGLSEIEKMAFWINAYNAITMKVVADAYPVRGIRWINFGFVWEVGRKAAGEKISLSDIEHEVLRPMGDPRIHFAINCASIGCPELPREPFYSGRLDEQLDREARAFINDPEKVRLDRGKNILYHSKIFDWFKEDFLAVAPSLKDYIQRYINDEDREYLKNHDVALKELDYDWGLNEQE